MFLYKIHNAPQDLNLVTKENVPPDPTFPTFFHVWITLQKLNSLFRVDKSTIEQCFAAHIVQCQQ